MATVVITVTDRPGGVTVLCESKHPPMPLIGDNEADLDLLTGAQQVALSALIEVADQTDSNWRTLLYNGDPPGDL